MSAAHAIQSCATLTRTVCYECRSYVEPDDPCRFHPDADVLEVQVLPASAYAPRDLDAEARAWQARQPIQLMPVQS